MGGEIREIVDADQVGHLFALLAIALPLLGLVGGWWYGARRQSANRGALYGMAVGLLGPINWLMWRVYNGITDHFGLDTVRNLFINLGVFVAVGIVAGIAAGLVMRRLDTVRGVRPPTDEAE